MMCVATANWTLFTDIRCLEICDVKNHIWLQAFLQGTETRARRKLQQLPGTRIVRERAPEHASEHRETALRLFSRGFVLDHIPMLEQHAVLDAQNVCGDPIHRSAEATKSAMYDHNVSLSHDCSRFVLQRRWQTLDQVEEAFASWGDMSAVLNVLRGPVALSRCIVTLVEQRVKSLENECLVRFLFSP